MPPPTMITSLEGAMLTNTMVRCRRMPKVGVEKTGEVQNNLFSCIDVITNHYIKLLSSQTTRSFLSRKVTVGALAAAKFVVQAASQGLELT